MYPTTCIPYKCQARRASALILIMAILGLIAVLVFGLIGFVSDQRGWARTKHEDALITQTLLSARAHAQRVIEQSYLTTHSSGGVTTTTQPWQTEFASTPASPPTNAWPKRTDPTYSTEAARQTRRQALVAGTWGTSNSYDLWRFETGLASPLVRSGTAPHGYEDGFTSHDGTGRWFTVAWLDRDLRPVDQAHASLQLRYAVAPVDISGLLLGNKARYEHLVSGTDTISGINAGTGGSKNTSATYRSGNNQQSSTLSPPVATSLYGATIDWTTQVPARNPATPNVVAHCPQTDRPIGAKDDTLGYDRIYYNTWRPLPVDHTFSANMLLTVGCGFDDSAPRTLADSLKNPSLGTIGPDIYYERVLGNLPDAWRNQGYLRVELKYWQMSRRFGDFLPFEQNPHPVTSGDAWKVTGFSSGTTLGAGTPVANRFPQALLAQLQETNIDPSLGNPNPYLMSFSENRRRLADLWNQIDYPNWWALQQGLRLHRVNIDSGVTGVPRAPIKADGLAQCWSPFGSPTGRFAGNPGSDTDRKNTYEMRYQWTPDANTAPPQVLANIVRLAVPSIPITGESAESVSQADRDLYESFVQSVGAGISSGRPYATQAALTTNVPLAGSTDPSIQRMLATCISGGGTPTDVGVGAGPRAEFTVEEWNKSDPAYPYVVVKGRHVRRFYIKRLDPTTPNATLDQADTEYRLRGWKIGSATSTPDLWVQYFPVVASPKFGSEYVSGSVGTWAYDANGTFTRIWLNPATDLTSIDKISHPLVIVHYPGISLTVGLSRWYRVAVRAELVDLDVPTASRDLSMDMVLHLDPDGSGNDPNTNMLWDSDIPYCDFENSLQWRTNSTAGSVVW